ncbi:hypothetical protein Pmani_016346 [Petrolisthes manimaculis]|uniref:Uncharacterized protein n=1 Tax=Petrolisthes manimaculis TaxID=1843537 RepID=A0AAE1PRU2_9EUCA|nr:hypothetical protein Pmani_016346 [Petrolisthes manimaculis]
MPSAATITAAAETVIHTVDHGLRTLGYDLKTLVKAFDLQTVRLLTLVVIVVTQILDSLADATKLYEKLEHNEVGQTRQAKLLL